MTLYERSHSFADPDFSLLPVVENDEGSRSHLDQIRSVGQQYIAVIISDITDTENTVVKVIKKDATELFEVVISKSSKLWDVNDNGEVLLYTETQAGASLVKELTCLTAAGGVKWSIDLTTELGGCSVHAIELGTAWAATVLYDLVKFYDGGTGAEVKGLHTGVNWVTNWNGGLNQECYGSNTGFNLVYKGTGDKVVFANKDGDFWDYLITYFYSSNKSYWITGRDTGCGRVSIEQTSQNVDYPSDWYHRVMVMWRTGERVEVLLGETAIERFVISPCGEWAMRALSNKVVEYYVTLSEMIEIGETSYGTGKVGQRSIDLSFYGKYGMVLHNDDELWAYQLKDKVSKDHLDNPLRSRTVMVCSD